MKWSDILPEEIMQKGDRLAAYADMLRASMDIYPPSDQVFRALSLTPPDKLKCVIVGQDPYHSPGAANGLAFSINPGRSLQPSLENIFKEYHDDTGYPVPASGDLTPWAEHGVLLLNTSLTVQRGCPNSHAGWGWDEFTGAVLEAAWKLPQPVVFVLWGANARRFALRVTFLPASNKEIIQSSHPSPFSANRGFFGSRPFTQVNTLLEKHGAEPVDWRL